MNCKALLNIAIEIALYKYCIIIVLLRIFCPMFSETRIMHGP